MGLLEELRSGVLVLRPEGEADLLALPVRADPIEARLAAGVRAFVWDLGAVGMLPSTAAGYLVQATRRVARAGGRMALARVPRRVRTTLRIMGVEDALSIHDDLATALAAVGGPGSSRAAEDA